MAKRKDPTKRRRTQPAASDTLRVPKTERISWTELKLSYLPLERRRKFLKPEDE